MKNDPVIQLLDQLLAGTSKVAAAEGDETGKTVPASTGSRGSENSKDVKDQVPGQSVDSADGKQEVSGAGANSPVFNIGAKSTATGEDVPAVKTTLPDPGTSHPAKTAAEKYSTVSALITGANDIAARAAVAAKTASAKQAELPAPLAAAIAKKDKKTKKDESGDAPEAPEAPSAPEATEDKLAAAIIDGEDLTAEKKAALWDEMCGFLIGTQAVDTLMQSAADKSQVKQASAQDAEAEFVKAAQQEIAVIFDAANTASNDLIHFLLAKQAEDAGADQLAAAGVDPSAVAGAEAAPADGGGQIDPAMLEQLLQELAAQGITPEDLLAAAGAGEGGGEEAAPEGSEEGDALDDARAAALGEEGTADDSEGAKKEARARRGKPTKSAGVKRAAGPNLGSVLNAQGLADKAKRPSAVHPKVNDPAKLDDLINGEGPFTQDEHGTYLDSNGNPTHPPTVAGAGAPPPPPGFWESLSATQKALLIGGGAGLTGLAGYGAYQAIKPKKKDEDDE